MQVEQVKEALKEAEETAAKALSEASVAIGKATSEARQVTLVLLCWPRNLMLGGGGNEVHRMSRNLSWPACPRGDRRKLESPASFALVLILNGVHRGLERVAMVSHEAPSGLLVDWRLHMSFNIHRSRSPAIGFVLPY